MNPARRRAYELLGRAAAGWPVAPEVWEIIREGYSGSRNSFSPTNALLRAVKRFQMADKKIPVMEVTPVAVDPQGPDISATPVLSPAVGARREGTISRLGLNGFTEIVDTATGEVVERIGNE
jgi:hypothetical protein